MRKGEKTRRHIIIKSAELFNQKGITGSSIQDIIEATGVTKGGIYRSFSSKDEIALEAFAYAGEVLQEHFEKAVGSAETALGKIMALCHIYSDTVNNTPIKGGCPFIISAVESDHALPALRGHTIAAFEGSLAMLQEILKLGIARGEFQADCDLESTASFIFSSLEGGIMVSRLTQDNKYVNYSIDNIETFLKTTIAVS
ncbi:TetR/AcrR family transcriptional regulator [Paenibacillus algorifonticola]|uniref:TetR/AcrR family transcriptional regulator n=1 Tax=Paenibacillus algorifonticola TaxID=684063 RepID=UPI003D2E9978